MRVICPRHEARSEVIRFSATPLTVMPSSAALIFSSDRPPMNVAMIRPSARMPATPYPVLSLITAIGFRSESIQSQNPARRQPLR